MATISYLNINMEYVMDLLYNGIFYINTYMYLIHGMNGSNIWPTTNYIPHLSLIKKRISGRSIIKRRRDASIILGSHAS